jgi:FMN phosphatase YigB (HAD superfamily)
VPYANAVLAELRVQSVLALATNAAASEEADIWVALDRVELKKLLDKVYCYCQIGHKKPCLGSRRTIELRVGKRTQSSNDCIEVERQNE